MEKAADESIDKPLLSDSVTSPLFYIILKRQVQIKSALKQHSHAHMNTWFSCSYWLQRAHFLMQFQCKSLQLKSLGGDNEASAECVRDIKLLSST